MKILIIFLCLFLTACQGEKGSIGPIGPIGPTGLEGISGTNGLTGNDGLDGDSSTITNYMYITNIGNIKERKEVIGTVLCQGTIVQYHNINIQLNSDIKVYLKLMEERYSTVHDGVRIVIVPGMVELQDITPLNTYDDSTFIIMISWWE